MQSTQTTQCSPNQTFPVIYNNTYYKVDPNCLIATSRKFKELIDPFMKQENQITGLHLTIVGDTFSNRSINNFLQLCQNLPSDVENSEMKEICEIAKMFQADQIYNTGISFIKSNLDPNFDVSDDKYNDKNYLIIEGATNLIHHAGDLDDLSFSDDEDTPTSTESKTDTNQNPQKPPKIKSIIYQIVCQHRPMQLSEYIFISVGQPLFTAKKKENIIYIAKGSEVHISKPESQIAQIIQNNDNTNIVHFHNQLIDFMVKYVGSGKPNHNSISVSFTNNNNNKQVDWNPYQPKYDAITNKYYLNFDGEYHHSPMNSKKNIVLQNKKGKKTFIVRRMTLNDYEVECLPLVDPLIAFVIAISDVIGPFNDPFADIDF